jgi:hypothetical protein
MLAGRYGKNGIKCTSIARKLCEVSLEKSPSPVTYISKRLKAEGASQQKRADRLEMELLEVKRLIPADKVAARRVDSAPSPTCADTICFTANAILRSNQSKSS